jgi:hypothetical protein
MTSKMAKKKNSNPNGRPTKYDPSYADMMVNYFKEAVDIFEETTGYKKEKKFKEFPTFEGFANFKLNVSKRTLENWRDEHEEFFRAYSQCKEIQEHIIIKGGITKSYSENFAWKLLNAVSVNYREKIEHTVDDQAKNLIKLAYSLPQSNKDD